MHYENTSISSIYFLFSFVKTTTVTNSNDCNHMNHTNDSILKEFEDAHAILKGHFILSSGLHSDTYMQCARVLMDAKRAERLCSQLAQRVKLSGLKFDMIVAPAMGGVVVGYEMGRQLGVESIFCERVNQKFTLRRGFNIPKNSNVLVVEDVVTTGKSSLETFECIEEHGGKVVGECSLVDRSNGEAATSLGVPLVSLLTINVRSFTSENIPSDLSLIEAVKPGSRFLQA
jgi:orotate phosphoribosyltransferase